MKWASPQTPPVINLGGAFQSFPCLSAALLPTKNRPFVLFNRCATSTSLPFIVPASLCSLAWPKEAKRHRHTEADRGKRRHRKTKTEKQKETEKQINTDIRQHIEKQEVGPPNLWEYDHDQENTNTALWDVDILCNEAPCLKMSAHGLHVVVFRYRIKDKQKEFWFQSDCCHGFRLSATICTPIQYFDGWSIGFFLCTGSGFCPSLPIIGFTCCVTWQVLKHLSSASRRYFVISWLQEFWGGSFLSSLSGLISSEPLGFFELALCPFLPRPRYICEWRALLLFSCISLVIGRRSIYVSKVTLIFLSWRTIVLLPFGRKLIFVLRAHGSDPVFRVCFCLAQPGSFLASRLFIIHSSTTSLEGCYSSFPLVSLSPLPFFPLVALASASDFQKCIFINLFQTLTIVDKDSH